MTTSPLYLRLPTLAYVIVLILCTLAAYRTSFRGEYIFDDLPCIQNNDDLRVLFPTTQETPKGLMGRPVGRISFTLNYWAAGRDPWSYHLVNLLIHLSAGLVLFDLIRRTLLRPGLADRYAAAAAPIAFAVAAIWLVHPLGTQAVTYIVQRLESLMALFYLGTLYCLLRAVEARWAWAWLLLAVVCCWLGMGTKEVMVTAPIAALLFDRIYLAGSWAEVWRKRWAVHLTLLCSMALPFLSLYSTSTSAGERTIAFGAENLTAWEYLRSQPGVLLHYLRLAFWPDKLCLDYKWPVADTFAKIYPAGLLILFLLAGSLALLWRRPRIGFIAFSFFLVLSPTSSFIPIDDLAFEHRMYLPLAAVVLLMVLAVYYLFERLQRREANLRFVPPVILVLLLACLILRTSHRNREYASKLCKCGKRSPFKFLTTTAHMATSRLYLRKRQDNWTKLALIFNAA